MSKHRKLIINIILVSILILMALVSTLLYINLYPRVSVHLISDNELLETLEIKKNSSIPALKSPEKEGYKFEGWYTDQNYNAPFEYGAELSDDVELYAKYSAIDYTLTFNYGDIQNIYAPSIQHFYDAVTLPTGEETILIKGEEVTLKTLKEGYKFAGWATTKNSTIANYGAGTEFLMPSSNVNLYAIWEPIEYSVKYYIQDLNKVDAVNDVVDGVVTYNANNQIMFTEVTYKYNTKVTAPNPPVNEQGYYQFVGWYEDPEFKKPINFNQTYMGLNQLSNVNLLPIYDTDNTDDIYLYGKWQVVYFNISFCLNSSTRNGTTYKVEDGSVMVTDQNGGYLDFFKTKEDVYYGLPLAYLDGGIYSEELLQNKVFYSYGASKDVVSHRFLGWSTTKTAPSSVNDYYKNTTRFNPEDFPRSYTNRDDGFSFLEAGIQTYVLYAIWEEYLHIEYSYNGSILDRQPVGDGDTGMLRDPAKMEKVKKSGYYFIGWSKTSDALNTGAIIYNVGEAYTFTTEASNSEKEGYLFFSTGNRKTTLYPIFKPNNYEIKYDFSINTLGDDGKLNIVIQNQPNDIKFSEYLTEKLAEKYIVRYNTTVNGRIESHTVLNTLDSEGKSNASYTDTNGETYLLLSWAVVDENNKVVATYNNNDEIYVNSVNSPVYKYSEEQSTGNHVYTIKAVWTKQMTIDFDKNHDSVEGDLPESISGMTGARIKLPASPNLIRPYHVFKGWITEDERFDVNGKENYNPSTLYLPNSTYSFSENTTLYAFWEPIEYKLNIQNTYLNGNPGSQIASISIAYGVYKNYVKQVTLGSTITIGEGANATTKLISPPQAGYALAGFSTSAGGEVVFANGDIVTILSKIGENNAFNPYPASNAKTFTIFAKYAMQKYDVLIDADGNGEFETTKNDIAHDTLLNTIMPNAELDTGYQIDYWFVETKDGSEEISDMNASDFKVTCDIRVSLVAKKQTFTATFHQIEPISGSIVGEKKIENIEYGNNLKIDNNQDEYRTYFGYVFDGWYLGDSKVDNFANQVVTGNITFKTKYNAEKVTIIYHANKEAGDTITATSNAYDYNSDTILPTQTLLGNDFVKEGYVLSAWALDANGQDLLGNANATKKLSTSTFDQALFTTIEGQIGYFIHVYAVYSKQYTVSFDFSAGNFTVTGNTSVASKYIAGTEINVAGFVGDNNIYIKPNKGYSFEEKKWYAKDKPATLYSEYETSKLVVDRDIVLVPYIEKITYTAVFNYKYPGQSSFTTLDGFTQVDIEIDNEDTKINIPSANDVKNILLYNGMTYRALSWYLQGAGGTYNLGQSFTLTEDIIPNSGTTLEFTLNLSAENDIKYNPNNANFSVKTLKAINGETLFVGYEGEVDEENLINFELEGWQITAWNTMKDGSGTTYNIGDSFEVSGSIIFYAVWNKKQATVVYNTNFPVASIENYTENTSVDWGTNYSIESKDWDCETTDKLYIITAWNTQADGNGTTYAVGETLNLKQEGVYNLYAVWTRAYNVVYSDEVTGQSYNGTEIILVGEEYTFIKIDDVSFSKEGHYIAKWKYNETEYDPTVSDANPSKAVVLADEVEGKTITFVAVWSAEKLDITIVYTNADGSDFTRNTYDTSYGATFTHTFNDARATLNFGGHAYEFVSFVDQQGKEYTLSGNILTVEGITRSLILTTQYQKKVTLTYHYGTNQTKVETYNAGTIIGGATNPFLSFTQDEMVQNGEGETVHVGWSDGSKYYTFITASSEIGYSYITENNFATSITLDDNVVLNLEKLYKYTLVVYDDLSYDKQQDKVTFTNSNASITLVQGDTYVLNYNDSFYAGFVIGGSDFTYNPDATHDYDAYDEFVLNDTIANAYSSDKIVYLYPLKYIHVTFKGLNGAEDTKTIIAGKTASPNTYATEDEKSYFDCWIIELSGEEIDFSTEQVFYEDTTILAVYKNFFSVQYLDSDIANKQLLNNTKIKEGEEVTLAGVYNNVGGVDVNYVKDNLELVGWYICYTENGTTGAFDTNMVALESVFNPREYAEEKVLIENNGDWKTNYYIAPAWKSALLTITFADNYDHSEFEIVEEVAGTQADVKASYKVEYNSSIEIDYVSDTEMSISFTAIEEVDNTRNPISTKVIVKALQLSANNVVTKWQFGGEDIDATYKFVTDGTISFSYDTSAVSIEVGVMYAGEIQSNDTYGYFYKGTNATSHLLSFSDKSGVSGQYNITLNAEKQTGSVVVEFAGWYIYDENSDSLVKIESDSIYSISNSGKRLEITNLKDDAVIYAVFTAGYITVNQTYTFQHVSGANIDSSNISSLTATYENVAKIDGVEYTGAVVTIDSQKSLSVTQNDTIEVSYSLSSSVYRFYGININYRYSGKDYTDTIVDGDGDGVVSYKVEKTVTHSITIIVVENQITLSFKGYDGETDLFTKTYQYGDLVGEIGLPSENGNQDDYTDGTKLYTFDGWASINADDVVTTNMDVTSNWIRVYRVKVEDGEDYTYAQLIYTASDDPATSLSGEYGNRVELVAQPRLKFRHDGYSLTYKNPTLETKTLDASTTYFLLNEISVSEINTATDITITPTYEKLYYILVYYDDILNATPIGDVAADDILNIDWEPIEGYSFQNWSIHYNQKTETISDITNVKLSEIIQLDNDNVHEIAIRANYAINTYTLQIISNNASKGNVDANNEGYLVNYGTSIAFSGRTVSFLNSLDEPVVITASTVGAYLFHGYNITNNSMVDGLNTLTITGDTTIYAIFVNAMVDVTASLNTYVGGTQKFDLEGGTITLDGQEPATAWDIDIETGTELNFTISVNTGFQLTSVQVKEGNGNYNTITPSEGVYSINIEDITDIQVRFDAIEYDITISMGNIDGLTETPYAFYLNDSGFIVNVPTTATTAFENVPYSTTKEISIMANGTYYQLTAVYQGANELEITKKEGKTVVTVEITGDVQIVVHVKYIPVKVYFYDYDGTLLSAKTKEYDYNTELTTAMIADVNLANHYYKADGSQATANADKVGGYRHTGWFYEENEEELVFAGITLTENLHLYPTHENIYFVKTTINSTYVSGGYTSNQEMGLDYLFSLHVPTSVNEGWEFKGYQCELASGIYISFVYDNGTWKLKNGAFDSEETTATLTPENGKYKFDEIFASYLDTTTQVVLVGQFEYQKYTLNFDVLTGGTLGLGDIYHSSDIDTKLYNYSLDVEYGYKVKYVEKALSEFGGQTCFEVTVSNREGGQVCKLYYVPASACEIGNMSYELKGETLSMMEDTNITIVASMTVHGSFSNGPAYVTFRFVADKNLDEKVDVVTLTLQNSGISGESVDEILRKNFETSIKNYLSGNATISSIIKEKANETTIQVKIPRTQSFKYTLTAGSYYSIHSVKQGEFTLENAGTILADSDKDIVVKLTLNKQSITIQDNFYNGTSNTATTSKGYVQLHYYEPVYTSGVITDFTMKTLGTSGTNQYTVDIYYTDEPYFTVESVTGFELKAIYETSYEEGEYNEETASYHSGSAHYILDLAYDSFYATFVEKEVTFTFKVLDLDVATATFKVSNVDGFVEMAKTLESMTIDGTEYQLNDVLMLNAYKEKFKNIIVNTVDVWDISNAYTNGSMLALSDTIILANTYDAKLLEVVAGENGAFDYNTSFEGHGRNWFVYSNTQRGSYYSDVVFKVKEGTSIPNITAYPDSGYESTFDYNDRDEEFTEAYKEMLGTDALKVNFVEKDVKVNVNIVGGDNNDSITLNGDIISLTSFNKGATTTFEELYDYIIKLLSDKYSKENDYFIETSTHYVYFANTSISFYYVLDTYTLYKKVSTPIESYDFSDALYIENTDELTVYVKFERQEKTKLELYNLNTQIVAIYLSEYDLVSMGSGFDLSQIEIPYGEGKVSLANYAYQYNFGLENEYFSHFSTEGNSTTRSSEKLNKPHTSRYLERFSLVDGVRSLNAEIQETTIAMTQNDVKLYLVSAPVVKLTITLSGENNDADTMLSQNGITAGSVVNDLVKEYWAGREVTKSMVVSAVQQYFTDKSFDMFEVLGIGTKDNINYTWPGFVIDINTQVNVVVRVSRTTTSVKVTHYNGATIDVGITYSDNIETPGYFSMASNDPYYLNTMPYVMNERFEWIVNPDLTESEAKVWAVPQGYMFVGYLVNGENYIIGKADGYYTLADGTKYEILKYDLSTNHIGVIQDGITQFTTIYYTAGSLNVNRVVTNYIDGVKSTDTLMYSKYGYSYEIAYKKWEISGGNYTLVEKTDTFYSTATNVYVEASVDDIRLRIIYADYYTITVSEVVNVMEYGKDPSIIELAEGHPFNYVDYILTCIENERMIEIGMRADYKTANLINLGDYTQSGHIYTLIAPGGGDPQVTEIDRSSNNPNARVIPIKGIPYYVNVMGSMSSVGANRINYSEFYYDPIYYKDGFVPKYDGTDPFSPSLDLSMTPNDTTAFFTSIILTDGAEVSAIKGTKSYGRYNNNVGKNNFRLNTSLLSQGDEITVSFMTGTDNYLSGLQKVSTGAYFLKDTVVGNRSKVIYNNVIYDINSNVIDIIINDMYETYKSQIGAEYNISDVDFTGKSNTISPGGMSTKGISWSKFREHYTAGTTVFVSSESVTANTPEIRIKYVTGLAKYVFIINNTNTDFDFKETDVTCSSTEKLNGKDLVTIEFDDTDKSFKVSGFYRHLGVVEVIDNGNANVIMLKFYDSEEDGAAAKTIRINISCAKTTTSNDDLVIYLSTKWDEQNQSVNTCDDPFINCSVTESVIKIYPRLLNTSGSLTKLDTQSTERSIVTIRTRADEIDKIDYSNVISFQSNQTYNTPINTTQIGKHSIQGVENIDYFNLTAFVNALNAHTSIKVIASTDFTNWYSTIAGDKIWQFNTKDNNPSLSANNTLKVDSTWYTLRGLMFGDYTSITTFGYNINTSTGVVLSSGVRKESTSSVTIGNLDENNNTMYLVIDENKLYTFSIEEEDFEYYTKEFGYTVSGLYDMPYLIYDSVDGYKTHIVSSSTSYENKFSRYPTKLTASTIKTNLINSLASGPAWGDNSTSSLKVNGKFASYAISTAYTKGLSLADGAYIFKLRFTQITSTVAFLGGPSSTWGDVISGRISKTDAEEIRDAINEGTLLYGTIEADGFFYTPTIAEIQRVYASENYQVDGNIVRYWTATNIANSGSRGISLFAPGAQVNTNSTSIIGGAELKVMWGVYAPSGDHNTYNATHMWTFADPDVLTGYKASSTALTKYFNSANSVNMVLPKWHFMKNSTTELTASEDDQIVATYAYKIDTIAFTGHLNGNSVWNGTTYNPGKIQSVTIQRNTTVINPGVNSDYGGTAGYTKSVDELIDDDPMISKLTWTHIGAQSLESYNTYLDGTSKTVDRALDTYSSKTYLSTYNRIIHHVPNCKNVNQTITDYYIDAMAFAYCQATNPSIYFYSARAIGSGAFYHSSDSFGYTEIKFADNLEYVGVQLFEGRGVNNSDPFNLIFYGQAPLQADGNITNGGHNDILFEKGHVVFMKATGTAPKFRIYYYAKFDKDNNGDNFSSWRYDGVGAYLCGSEQYLASAYRFIEAPSNLFNIVDNKIQGIYASGVSILQSSSSPHHQYLVLPSKSGSNTITSVEYIGAVSTLNNDALKLIKIYVQGNQNVGSIYHYGDTRRAISMGHGVQYIDVAVNTIGSGNYTLGDGTYIPFDVINLNPDIETSLIEVNLPHIKIVNSASKGQDLGYRYSGTKVSSGDGLDYHSNTIQKLSLSSATSIGANAFYNFESLSEVLIPQIASVGDYSFAYCTSITSITSPQLSTIGNYAFAQCTELTSIGMGSVLGRGTLSLGANNIGEHFAEGTKISTVHILDLATIGGASTQDVVPNAAAAFYGMNYLKEFKVYDHMSGTIIDAFVDSNNSPTSINSLYSLKSENHAILRRRNNFASVGSYQDWIIKMANGVTSFGNDNWVEHDGVIYDRAFEGSKLTTIKFNSVGSYSGMVLGQKVFNESEVETIQFAQVVDAVNVVNLKDCSNISYATGTFIQKLKIGNENNSRIANGNLTFGGASKLKKIEYVKNSNGVNTYESQKQSNPNIVEFYDGCVYMPYSFTSTNNYYYFVFVPEGKTGLIATNVNTEAICAEAFTNNNGVDQLLIQTSTIKNISEKAFYQAKKLSSISVTTSQTYNSKSKYFSYDGVLYMQTYEDTAQYMYEAYCYCTSPQCGYGSTGPASATSPTIVSTFISNTYYGEDCDIAETNWESYSYSCGRCRGSVATSGIRFSLVETYYPEEPYYSRTLVSCPPAKTGTLDMRQLENMTTSIKAKIETIGPFAFYNTQLSTLHISKDVKSISTNNTFTGVVNNLTIWNHATGDSFDWGEVYFDDMKVTLALLNTVYRDLQPYNTNAVKLFSTTALKQSQVYGFFDTNPYAARHPFDLTNKMYKFTNKVYGSLPYSGGGTPSLGSNVASMFCEGCGMWYWGYVSNPSDNNKLANKWDPANVVSGTKYYDYMYICRNCTFKDEIAYSTYDSVNGLVNKSNNYMLIGKGNEKNVNNQLDKI